MRFLINILIIFCAAKNGKNPASDIFFGHDIQSDEQTFS